MEWNEILDLGLSAVLLYLLTSERSERKAMTDRIFGYLEEARRKRHEMANALTSAALRADRDAEQKP